MKAFIISMINHQESTIAMRRLIRSIKSTKSRIDPFVFPAVTPENMADIIDDHFNNRPIKNIDWTYPIKPEDDRFDIRSGLYLKHYPTKNIQNRISCFLSHYILWKHCYQIGMPIMILEHDAFFQNKFNYSDIKNQFTGGILGLNDPIGATRRASVFDAKVRAEKNRLNVEQKVTPDYRVVDCPWVDDDRQIPQGIAGNSAYIIKPEAAAKLMGLVAEHGFWPNDAIMCKQLMPNTLQTVFPYYTNIQKGLKSTTTN